MESHKIHVPNHQPNSYETQNVGYKNRRDFRTAFIMVSIPQGKDRNS
jgi:hypothetical protein